MAEVFKNTQLQFGGSFPADRGLVAGLTDGVMMQNLRVDYAQVVNRIYEMGQAGQTPFFYYVSGRSQGTIAAGHVIGPRLAFAQYYERYSDVCRAADNALLLSLTRAECAGGSVANVFFLARHCVLVNIGIAGNANDLLITENSQLMFTGLDLTQRRTGGIRALAA